EVSDLSAAAYLIIQSAFITAGQRCTCARRLILLEHEADAILGRLIDMTKRLHVGPHTDMPEPFIGPVISPAAAEALMAAQADLVQRGAVVLLPMQRESEISDSQPQISNFQSQMPTLL